MTFDSAAKGIVANETYDTRFSANEVSVARGGQIIVSGVSLEARPGDAILLRGPNGAGKTTLLRAFAGLMTPAAGTVCVAAEQSVFCGADNAVKGALSVDENLAFWAALYDAPATARTDARDVLRLTLYAERRASALSTGLRRRLALSRLTLANRAIWFVDEPISGLDAPSATTFTKMVEDHRGRGGIAIIATHDDLALENVRTFELEIS